MTGPEYPRVIYTNDADEFRIVVAIFRSEPTFSLERNIPDAFGEPSWRRLDYLPTVVGDMMIELDMLANPSSYQ